ncbi:hypothetical protein LLG95_18080 [bacterium]|nr:hypothetical protein [bacterium]
MRRSSIQILVWLCAWVAAAAWLSFEISPREQGPDIAMNLGNSVLAGQDTVSHDYPAMWWGWQQIRQTGRIPLWNPSWFAGEPFVASQTFMPFYPPSWLSAFLRFPLAFNIQYPLHLMLAAMAMAWACRRRGLGWLAAGLAGLSWGFGGHLATLVGPGHIQKLQTLAWLPVVTTGMRELAGDRPRRGLIPFAFGLALQITAGHLQIVWLTLVAGGLEAIAAIVKTSVGSGESFFRKLGWGLMAVALALGLSAAFWVPTVEFARLSNRQGKLSWEDETRGSLPLEEAIEFALPRLLGDSMPNGRGSYVGRYGESLPDSPIKLAPERVVSDYVGAGVLIFAIFGLLIGFSAPRIEDGISVRSSYFSLLWNNGALGYILLAAAALLLSMGRYLPHFYKLALAIIPGLAHFRSPSTMMAVFAYGMSMAAAIGANSFFGLGSKPSRRAFSRIDLSAIGTAMACAIAGAIALSWIQIPDTPETHTSILVLAAARHTIWGLLTIITPMIVWALIVARGNLLPSRRVLAPVLIGLIVVAWGRDLVANDRPFWTAIYARPYEEWLTHHWALERWGREDEPVRYIHLGNELSNQALTLSDTKHFLEIASVHGYHPVAYGRYFDLLSKLGFTNLNFARLFGMQFMITPTGMAPPPGWQIVEQSPNRQLHLLYNPRVEYIRQVRHLKVVADWKALLDRLAQPNFNPYESTTVTNDDVDNKPEYFGKSVGLPDMHLQARVFPTGPGRIDLRITTIHHGPIELAQPWAPGWRLLMNGQEADTRLMRLDGYFVGILAPAGQNAFELYYDPVSQRVGIYFTLLSLAFIGFMIGFNLIRETKPGLVAPDS